MAQRVHSAKRISPQIMDYFRPIVADAIQSYITEPYQRNFRQSNANCRDSRTHDISVEQTSVAGPPCLYQHKERIRKALKLKLEPQKDPE